MPQPERFLALLCQKLGADPEAWQHVHLEVETYQVTEFRESDFKAQPGIDHPTARPTA